MESNEKKPKRPRIGETRPASDANETRFEKVNYASSSTDSQTGTSSDVTSSSQQGGYQSRGYNNYRQQGGYNRQGGYNNNYRQGGYNNRYNNNYQQGGYNRYNNSTLAEGASEAGEGENKGYQPRQQGGYQPRYNNNRQGGYNNNRQGGYGNNRYNNHYQQRPYQPRQQAEFSATDSAEGTSTETAGENAAATPAAGGYQPRYNNYRQGGYNNNRQGGYGNNRQGGYNNRQGGFNNRQGGYNNRQGGFNNRQGGYNNNRQGGFNNRQGGYNNNRQGGFNNRQQGRPGQFRQPQGKSFVPRPKRIEYEMPIPDPNEQIRLNKFMANAGLCSRREADEFIEKGLIKVNGNVVTELGTKISHNDVVEFNDKVVALESKCYILLNKPKDCVTTSDDPNGRTTVMDIVKGACSERIYPVGRLDRNTTGVLLLTNDGDLASKLTHPKFVKKKIYHVWTDKDIAEEDMQRIADGIELDDGPIHADAISYATETDKNQAGIEIHSGRNRIVRRIFESLGYHVTKLDRVYFAGLTKKNLPRGRWRYLTQEEVNFLKMGSFE